MLAAVAALALTACTIAKVSGRGALPIVMNNPPQKVTVLKHIEVEKSVSFDYTNAYDASQILADEIAAANADAVINTSFEVKSTLGSVMLNTFTLGLANAKVVKISADLVKYQ
jgi:hypothetical protein